jgi:septal ring factor EnvC (AmiA/AmiB activator)
MNAKHQVAIMMMEMAGALDESAAENKKLAEQLNNFAAARDKKEADHKAEVQKLKDRIEELENAKPRKAGKAN